MAESVCFVPSLRLRIIEIENHPYLSTLFSKEFGYTLAIFASELPIPTKCKYREFKGALYRAMKNRSMHSAPVLAA